LNPITLINPLYPRLFPQIWGFDWTFKNCLQMKPVAYKGLTNKRDEMLPHSVPMTRASGNSLRTADSVRTHCLQTLNI